MNQYIFTTHEGYTVAPAQEVEVENCQLLARVDAQDIATAKRLLVKENQWILDGKYNTDICTIDQVVTGEQMSDIKAIIEYLWHDEEKSYEECECPEDHIFVVIKRLRAMIADDL